MAALVLLSQYKMKKLKRPAPPKESEIPVDMKTMRAFRGEMSAFKDEMTAMRADMAAMRADMNALRARSTSHLNDRIYG